MASFDFNSPRHEAGDEGDEALWQLLGRARRIEASPYFTRKVLRAIDTPPQPAWWRCVLRVFAPAAVCAGIAILAVAGTGGVASPAAMANADIEFETIRNLDLMVSSYESSLWLDPSFP